MSITTPGLGAYETAIRASDAELVAGLREVLGAKLVAYLGSVQETRAVRQWAEGERAPSGATMNRLRLAFHAAGILVEREHPRVVQAWFTGLNPQLDDASPARLIRESPDLDEAGARILASARSFVSNA
ncbi:hypothetical protein BFL36_11440 [Clavibacter michiganensis]|uniref:Uncharacterized protein n=1 Tax=Clavibacter michiganensis TaxID=28447 RepID=A0A251Y869_9MICO|nr:hypothetical protein [Clavibacter michiganensis]OUE20269.1 hypothetical protein BFL36_11440 [Clavibacter michiganensis]